MDIDEIMARLEVTRDPMNVEGMARFGIRTDKVFGTKVPVLRKLAKEIGKDHDLALKLWEKGYRETRVLAAMVDEPGKVTEGQVDRWVADLDNWEVCDQCCMNIFDKLPFAYEKAKELTRRGPEFEKRAGFALIACLAWHDKEVPDEKLMEFLPCIKDGADDDRNYVKKAVSWALRHIGKRNLALNKEAIKTAKDLQKMDSKAARWVASDVLRELKSEKVLERLRR